LSKGNKNVLLSGDRRYSGYKEHFIRISWSSTNGKEIAKWSNRELKLKGVEKV